MKTTVSCNRGSPLTKEDATECCPLCRGSLLERKYKRFCERCGVLCETCCDGGRA